MFLGLSPSVISKPRMVGGSSAPAAPTDPDFANVSSLLHFDGNLTDQKSRVWSAVGNAAATGTAKWGTNGLALDGAGDYLLSDLNASLTLDGDFTAEAWVNTANIANNNQAVFATRWGSPLSVTGWFLIYYHSTQAQGTFSLFVYTHSGGAPLITTSASGIANNTYGHLALTRSGTAWRIFFNGTQIGSATSSAAISLPIRTIGEVVNNSDVPYGNYWEGVIDDSRITKGVARYTANFTPPTAAFPDA